MRSINTGIVKKHKVEEKQNQKIPNSNINGKLYGISFELRTA